MVKRRSAFLGKSLPYLSNFLATIVLAFLALSLTLEEVSKNILLPESDQFTDYVFARNFYWTGNFFQFPAVGNSPLENSDYPIAILFDARKWALMGGLIKLGLSPIAAVNLSLLLSFPIVSISMLMLLRYLKLNFWLSFSLAICFAFLPWHILRLVHGFSFADYSIVPATIYILLVFGRKMLGHEIIEVPGFSNAGKLIFVTTWVATSGSYYIYFSILTITCGLFLFALLRVGLVNMIRAVHKLLFLFTSSLIVTLFIQFAFWKLAVLQSSDLQPSQKSITENFMYALLPFSILLPTVSNFETFPISRISGALESWRPQSFCLDDHMKNGIMKFTCSVNFESLAFVSFPAAIIGCSTILIIARHFIGTFGTNLITKTSNLPTKNRKANKKLENTRMIVEHKENITLLSFGFLGALAISSIGGLSIFLAAVYPNFRVYGRMSIFVIGILFVIFALHFDKIKKRTFQIVASVIILISSALNSSIFTEDFATYDPLNKTLMESVKKLSDNSPETCSIAVLPAVTALYPFQDISQRSLGQFPYEGAMFYAMSDKLMFNAGLTFASFTEANNQLVPYERQIDTAQSLTKNYCGFVYIGDDDEITSKLRFLNKSFRLVYQNSLTLMLNSGDSVSQPIRAYLF